MWVEVGDLEEFNQFDTVVDLFLNFTAPYFSCTAGYFSLTTPLLATQSSYMHWKIMFRTCFSYHNPKGYVMFNMF